MGISRLFREIPTCPMCEGPCVHDLERSEAVFSRSLPKSTTGSADPEPARKRKANRRGRRPEHHSPQGPSEDRAVRPAEDREAP